MVQKNKQRIVEIPKMKIPPPPIDEFGFGADVGPTESKEKRQIALKTGMNGITPSEAQNYQAIATLASDLEIPIGQVEGMIAKHWPKISSNYAFFENSRRDKDAKFYCPKPYVSQENVAIACIGAAIIEERLGIKQSVTLAKWAYESQFDENANSGTGVGVGQLVPITITDIVERNSMIDDSLKISGKEPLPDSIGKLDYGKIEIPLTIKSKVNPKVGKDRYDEYLTDLGHAMALSSAALLVKLTYVNSIKKKPITKMGREEYILLLNKYNTVYPEYGEKIMNLSAKLEKNQAQR